MKFALRYQFGLTPCVRVYQNRRCIFFGVVTFLSLFLWHPILYGTVRKNETFLVIAAGTRARAGQCTTTVPSNEEPSTSIDAIDISRQNEQNTGGSH